MTDALTPTIALAYLRELSTDLRAAIVLDASGERLAGDEAIAPAARELLHGLDLAAPDSAGPCHIAVPTSTGVALAARSGGRAIVVVAGPHALTPLLLHDVQTLLGDLEGQPAASKAARTARSAANTNVATRAAHALIVAAAPRG